MSLSGSKRWVQGRDVDRVIENSRRQETGADEENDDFGEYHIARQIDTLYLDFTLVQHCAHSDGNSNIDDAGNCKGEVKDPL